MTPVARALHGLVRVYRLMSAYGLKNIVRGFIRDRADNALLVVVFMVLIVIEFGSMAVVYFEADAPNANITTGGDAVWWAFVSITTVGYGDKFPVTEGGRTCAFFVLAAGVGLFGVLSGYLANFFLSPAAADDPEPAAAPAPVSSEPVAAGADDDASLLRMVDDLEANVASLRARIADRAQRPDPPGAAG